MFAFVITSARPFATNRSCSAVLPRHRGLDQYIAIALLFVVGCYGFTTVLSPEILEKDVRRAGQPRSRRDVEGEGEAIDILRLSPGKSFLLV
jgi:hypothetical protein